MYSDLIIPILGIISAIIIAAFSYFLTKWKEREAEWRKCKLDFYVKFIESIDGILVGNVSQEGKVRFSKASNNLMLFAPQNVLDEIYKYRELPGRYPDASLGEHDKILSSMMLAIRNDIGIRPKDNPKIFSVNLWVASKD